MRRLWAPLLLCTVSAFAAEFGLTETPLLPMANHGYIGLSWNSYNVRTPAGAPFKKVFSIPVFLDHALIDNVSAGLGIKLNGGKDAYGDNISGTVEGGQVSSRLRIGWQDAEYETEKAIEFFVHIRGGTAVDSSSLSSKVNPWSDEAGGRDLYPAGLNMGHYSLGWLWHKKAGRRTSFTCNARYVYAMTDEEYVGFPAVLSNLFPFSGLRRVTGISTNSSGKAETNKVFTFFGLDSIFKKWFWRQEGSDPWAEKKNDWFEASVCIDTYLQTDYYFRNRRIPLSLKPFIEVSLSRRFSEEGLMRSQALVTPGAILRWGSHLRLTALYKRVLWHEPGWTAGDAAELGLRWNY